MWTGSSGSWQPTPASSPFLLEVSWPKRTQGLSHLCLGLTVAPFSGALLSPHLLLLQLPGSAPAPALSLFHSWPQPVQGSQGSQGVPSPAQPLAWWITSSVSCCSAPCPRPEKPGRTLREGQGCVMPAGDQRSTLAGSTLHREPAAMLPPACTCQAARSDAQGGAGSGCCGGGTLGNAVS